MVLGHLTGFGIPVPEIAERSVAGHLLHLCVGENGDLLVVSGCIRCCLGAGEVVSRMRMVTWRAYLVRNTLSSAAAKPPPTTKTSFPVKNSPSQVAQ